MKILARIQLAGMGKVWASRSSRPVFLVAVVVWIGLGAVVLRPEPLASSTMPVVLSGPRRTFASLPRQGAFKPAGVISASDVHYPFNTDAEGIVVFDVLLNASGKISSINALTDVPPLTNAAESSLSAWKFIPASSDGAAEASQMLVALVFRHAIQGRNPPAFSPVFAPSQGTSYTPPGITSAAYADYPTSTIAAGAIVLEETIRADGGIKNARVVRGMSGGFAPLALKAASQWGFEPAMWNGSAVTSKVAIAFVFSSRALNPF